MYASDRYYSPELTYTYSTDRHWYNRPHQSSYVWCGQNPIMRIDTDGMDDYFDDKTGKYIGNDNSSTNNMRLISTREYNRIMNGNGNDKIGALQTAGRKITIDAMGIQLELDRVWLASTSGTGKEAQTYLVLDRENAKITAIAGRTGRNGEFTMSVTERSDNGIPYSTVEKDGRTLILIGQVHGHPKDDDPRRTTLKTMSIEDRTLSHDSKIPIYAIDAMDGLRGSQDIHRVTPNGTVTNKIGRVGFETAREIGRQAMYLKQNK